MHYYPAPDQRLWRLDIDYCGAPDLLARLALFPPSQRPFLMAAPDRESIRLYLWPRGMTGYEMARRLERYYPIPLSPFTLTTIERRAAYVTGSLISKLVEHRIRERAV